MLARLLAVWLDRIARSLARSLARLIARSLTRAAFDDAAGAMGGASAGCFGTRRAMGPIDAWLVDWLAVSQLVEWLVG